MTKTDTLCRTAGRPGRRVAQAIAILGLAASLLFAGFGAAPANAYSFPSPIGTTGPFNVGSAYVVYGANGAFSPPRIGGPTVIVARSASVAPNALQKVSVTYSVQRWSGSWVNAGAKTFTAWISAGQSYASFVPNSLGDFSPGYYRVTGTVAWYDASSFNLAGYRYFYPTLASENRCSISNCIAYNGYVWFG